MSGDRLTVEVDLGSASSWDRPASRAFLVRIRRGDDYVITIGLTRASAETLAERLRQLLG